MESEIISWANRRLQEGGKNISIKHFQDKVQWGTGWTLYFILLWINIQTIKTALPIIHLIDVLHPGLIDWSIVKQGEKITGPVSLVII